jgi:hypothetical protein
MQTITLHSHVGEDRILHLDVPVGLIDADLEVTLTVQAVKSLPEGSWSPGFFEKTFGAWEGEPLVREEQGEFEQRESLD